MTLRYYLQKIIKSHEMGLINEDVLREFFNKLPIIDSIVNEIEKIFDLKYPPVIIDPSLMIMRHPSSFTTTVIYALTKIQKLNDEYRICIEISLPFLLFAREDLIKACLVHEFLHYIFATITIGRKDFEKLSSQKPISLEVLIGFDDAYMVKPEDWIRDCEVINLLKKYFNPIIKDSDLEEKINENWIKRSLPIKEIRAEDIQIRIPVLDIDKILLDNKILEHIKL